MVGGMCGACVVGGKHGRGACVTGGMRGGGVCMAGGAWQERRLLQRMVRILLECILVNEMRVNPCEVRLNVEKLEKLRTIPLCQTLKSITSRRHIPAAVNRS